MIDNKNELYHYGIPQTPDGKGSGRYRKNWHPSKTRYGSVNSGYRDSTGNNLRPVKIGDPKKGHKVTETANDVIMNLDRKYDKLGHSIRKKILNKVENSKKIGRAKGFIYLNMLEEARATQEAHIEYNKKQLKDLESGPGWFDLDKALAKQATKRLNQSNGFYERDQKETITTSNAVLKKLQDSGYTVKKYTKTLNVEVATRKEYNVELHKDVEVPITMPVISYGYTISKKKKG